MYKLLLSLLMIVCYVAASAQNSKMVDSLLKRLDTEKADSIKMKIYRKLGDYYMDNNAGKAIEYLENSLEIAKKLDMPLQIANNYYSIGFCNLIKSDFNKALENYLQSIRIYEKLKDSFRLSNGLMAIGTLYSETKDFKKTNEYYNKALQLIEAQKDTVQLASILAQKGNLYDQQLQEYDTALIYLKKSLSLARAIKVDYLVTNALGNIGLIYKHQFQTNKALQYFDSALLAYETMDAPVDNYAAIYNNIAATHSQAGNYQQAKIAFDKSIQFALKAGSPYIEMENYNNQADMYSRMKNFELQSVFLKKYYNIKDSLFTADNKNHLTQLETDYQMEKKNTEITKKEAEVVKQKSQRNVFVLIAGGTALLLLTLLFFYRKIKINNQLLQKKNIQINQQKEELETLNQVKDRLFSIISHDLRNPLITLRTYLSLADDVTLTADKKELFKRSTMQAVTQTCEMLDNLLLWANLQIKNTNPSITPVNINDCILDAVNTIQAQATQKQIAVKTTVASEVALGDLTIVTIALRNLLTNAIKYSPSGSLVNIDAEKKGNDLLIKIKDAGIGMTAEQLLHLNTRQTDTTMGTNGEKGSGLGIFLVQELLEKINGRLTIESTQGHGSCFTILLPAL